jgi:WD40 repeat protein
VQVWEAATGTLVHRYESHNDWTAVVAWSPDGRHLASVSSPQRGMQVWESTTWKLLRQFENDSGAVQAVAWSPDGNQLASSSYESVQVWAVHNGEVLLTYPGSVSDVAWSPGGKRIASASFGVWLWVAPHR